MKKLAIILLILHTFIGIGALLGGTGGMLEPEGPMGVSTDSLKNGPFTNFFIPGLFLFVVIGLGNLFTAYTIYKKWTYFGYFSGGMSVILMMWIIIQCFILESILALHVIFFTLGLIGAIIATILSYHHKVFPFNRLKNT